MRQKGIRITSKMRQKCPEHLWGGNTFWTIPIFERPQSALDCVIMVISSSMGVLQGLFPKLGIRVLGVSVIPHVLISRGLMAYYERDGSDYKEMENHSNQALQMTCWSTRSLLVTGCDNSYVTKLNNYRLTTAALFGDYSKAATSMVGCYSFPIEVEG